MNIVLKNIIKIILIIFLLLMPNIILANSEDLIFRTDQVADEAGYSDAGTVTGDEDLAAYIGQIISYILAMLGVIFLILTIYAGFLWMTAQGDSEVVTKAKDMMTNAIIGLIIVLMSYAVSYYIVSKVSKTTIENSGFTDQ